MKKSIWLAMALIFVLVLAACGGGGNNNGGNGNEVDDANATPLEIVATNFAFDKEEYVVPAGAVKVTLKNNEGYHNVKIEGVGTVNEGQEKTFNLKPGEYKLACDILCGTGHNDMVAKLIVQ